MGYSDQMMHLRFVFWAVLSLVFFFPVAQAEEHDWKSKSGNTVRAEFVFATEDSVTLSVKGKNFAVKMSLLSPESQALARKLAANSAVKVDPEAMVRGIAKAFAAKNYDAFRKFTCLGMEKDAFKQFMAMNDDRKVVRTWDPVRDDFQEKLVAEMQEAYEGILQEARDKGFDWSQAKIVECEYDGDVKAELRSGNVELDIHLDDCFLTPQGLLMFDAPRAR